MKTNIKKRTFSAERVLVMLCSVCALGLFLLNFFSADMLNYDLVHLHGFAGDGNFLFHHSGAGIIFGCKLPYQLDGLLAILDQTAFSEYNGAAHIGRPSFVLYPLVSVYGEADPVVLF